MNMYIYLLILFLILIIYLLLKWIINLPRMRILIIFTQSGNKVLLYLSIISYQKE